MQPNRTGYFHTYERPQPRPPTCRGCGARIVYVQMQRKEDGRYVPGSKMPCEPQWEYGDGRKTLVTHEGIMVQKAPPAVLGREPHFGNCPAYRRRAQSTAPEERVSESKDTRLERILSLVDL